MAPKLPINIPGGKIQGGKSSRRTKQSKACKKKKAMRKTKKPTKHRRKHKK